MCHAPGQKDVIFLTHNCGLKISEDHKVRTNN